MEIVSTELAFISLTAIAMSFVLFTFYLGRIWTVGFIAILLVLSNIVGPKIVSIFGFAITAGTPIFAALPLATDLLTEKYGKEAARQGVFLAFCGMIFFASISQLVILMPTIGFAQAPGDAVDLIFSASLRLMIASPVAYLIWQMVDIWVYHWIYEKTGPAHLWARNNISTVIAQAGSTYTFFFLGFAGTGEAWVEIATVSVVFYWIIAAFDTIVVYLSRRITPRDLIKARESIEG